MKYIQVCKQCNNSFPSKESAKQMFCDKKCEWEFNRLKRMSRSFGHCKNPICYNFFLCYKGHFCTNSCAAKTNNSSRTIKIKQKILPEKKISKRIVNIKKAKIIDPTKFNKEKWLLIMRLAIKEAKESKYEFSRLLVNKCKYCDKIWIANSQRQICDHHRYLHSTNIRMDYYFNFNPFHYPDLFNLNMIKELGWYHTKGNHKRKNLIENKNGVSKDHRVSIADAIKFGYDSYYISHPINCKIMTQRQNLQKGSKSSITYNELISLVDIFDETDSRHKIIFKKENNRI